MRTLHVAAGLAAGLAVSISAASARADETFSGPGGPLVDNNGTDNGVAFFDIVVSGFPGTNVAALESITFNSLTHTWLGDLVIALVAPDNTTFVTVTSPPALENANLNGTYTFVVDDQLPFQFQTLDEAAGPLGDTSNVPSSTLAASDWGNGDPGPRVNWQEMQEVELDGTWQVQFHDFFEGDTGALGSWSFTVSIPEPACAGLLGLTALACLCRRRQI